MSIQSAELLSIPPRENLTASLTATLHSDIGTTEFVLPAVGHIHERWAAVPLSRGSGVQMSGVRANALLCIPPDIEGVEAGDEVMVELLAEREEVASSLLVTGSHDPAIDHLAELAQRRGWRSIPRTPAAWGGCWP